MSRPTLPRISTLPIIPSCCRSDVTRACLPHCGLRLCPLRARCVPAPTTRFGGTGHQVVIGDFHFAFAIIAFVMLGVMALRFAKREPTPPGPGVARLGRSLLALEMIMLTAFGLSWFVKGQKILSGG